jgi:hypothetical protein
MSSILTAAKKAIKLRIKISKVVCLVFSPVNQPYRSGALARRNERFNFDSFLLAGLTKRRIRAFMTNPTEKSINRSETVE